MTLVKKILAVLALISMAVFVVCILLSLFVESMHGKPAVMMIPLTCFLMFGLLSLGINWLMKLRDEARKEQENGNGN